MDGSSKKDRAPAASSTVDFGGLGSTGLGGGDFSAPTRVPLGRHAVDAPEPVRGGVNDGLAGYETSAHALARSRLWASDADDAGGADPAEPAFPQAGRGADPLIVRDREPAVLDMAADHLLPAGGDDMMLGGMMRPAALLAMQVGALTLISDPDAPWPNQFVSLLIWLAGCVALFLSRH